MAVSFIEPCMNNCWSDQIIDSDRFLPFLAAVLCRALFNKYMYQALYIVIVRSAVEWRVNWRRVCVVLSSGLTLKFLFFALSHTRHDLTKKIIENKLCFDFLYNVCRKYFSFQEEMSKICSKMHISLIVHYPLILWDVKEIWIFFADLRKILKYHISWASVSWVLSRSMRADGRTDRHDVANSRFSQYCERASERNLTGQYRVRRGGTAICHKAYKIVVGVLRYVIKRIKLWWGYCDMS